MRAALSQVQSESPVAPVSMAASAVVAPVVLDLKHLRRFTFGSPAFEREIMGLFAAELPKSQAALKTASTAAQWHMAAHTLKGSALGVGAGRLALAAREAEVKSFEDASGRSALLARIEGAITEVVAEAQRLELLPALG